MSSSERFIREAEGDVGQLVRGAMAAAQPPERKALYRQAMRAGFLGLGINLALGIAKLVGGIVGNSFALIADAINSLGDVFTSLMVLPAFWVAQRPADPEHPYGHTRAEAIAASNVAMLVILSALWVGWEAIGRLGVHHDPPPAWTMWIAGINLVIKESLYWYKISVGRRTGSQALIATAWDHRSDALCCLAVLVGLGLVRWGGERMMWADEVAALFVVAAISWTGIELFGQAATNLMDRQAGEEFVDQIRASAAAVAGVRRVEKLLVRKSGLEYFVDIHVEVDGQMSVAEGHEVGHQVTDRVMADHHMVRDVISHVEPA